MSVFTLFLCKFVQTCLARLALLYSRLSLHNIFVNSYLANSILFILQLCALQCSSLVRLFGLSTEYLLNTHTLMNIYIHIYTCLVVDDDSHQFILLFHLFISWIDVHIAPDALFRSCNGMPKKPVKFEHCFPNR